ncbi:MAG TPA: TraR/DksA family transcriptional regulator [Pyrinomonadaceae bacterium]|nr:TraR/DksA family transcriptional regulator [Pyrinomonadaceae bacterium]
MRDLTKVKEQLEERKREIQEQLGEVAKDLRQELYNFPEDQAIQIEQEEVPRAREHSLYEELTKIDNALIRIHEDEYGKCENCGNEIGEKRLEAIPYADLCIDCAEEISG